MKTKFILGGGFRPGQIDENNSDFYKEILKDAPEEARVLLVPFAKDEDRIVAATARVSSDLHSNKHQQSITIDIATAQDFLEKLATADVVYFHGGASLKLLEALKNYPTLEKLIEGKIIAGESAGANVWTAFFYSPRADQVSQGLGILPIKMIPHYKEEYTGKLDHVGSDLEEVLLPEYTYKIFYS